MARGCRHVQGPVRLCKREEARQLSVMIEKFAVIRRSAGSEFLDLNHTAKDMVLVSLLIPKFARDTSSKLGRTSESGH